MAWVRKVAVGLPSLVLMAQLILPQMALSPASADVLAIEPPVCSGDCGGDNEVTVDELVTGVRIVLELEALANCSSLDIDGDSRVTINELVVAVNHLLEGCPLADMCGGIAGLPCRRGEICELPPGSCNIADAQGMCEPVSPQCLEIFAPVCGCDGMTYANDCLRRANQVAKDHDGPCSAMCGGFAGVPCERGSFCELPPGACRIPDVGGMCTPIAMACPLVFLPVCGCDGKTYGNDCERQAAAVSKDYDGPCDNRCGGLAGRACERGQFCDFPVGSCGIADIAGTCEDVPEICTRIFAPVCGCNHMTYANDCARQAAQVTKDHDGACEGPAGVQGH